MFVACPHCGFLVASLGTPTRRCPRCGGAVEAGQAQPLETEADAPAAGEDADGATARAADAADTDTAGATDADTPADTSTDTAAAAAAGEPVPVAPATSPVRRSQRAPSFVRRHAPALAHSSDRRWWWIVVALALLLALQLLLAQREELAANARWRPAISRLCGVLHCEIPTWREPTAFTMLQRSVRPKPGVVGVLRVDASFRNDARWAQPWPTVLLTLSDMEGRPVGLRAFQPHEYLRGHGDDRIAPGQSATIRFDVIEPAQRVVAFTFDFK